MLASCCSRIPFSAGSRSSPAREVHASAGVPPTEEWIKPTGTPSARRRSRPKNQATAENFAAVSGADSCHAPEVSERGVSVARRGTLNRRSWESRAPAIASAALAARSNMKAIFDCPLHSHTSPTRTFETTRVLLSLATLSV